MPNDAIPLEHPYICGVCGARFSEPGDCATHIEEPLLDLREQEVRLMLDKADWTSQRKRQVMIGGLVILGLSPFVIGSFVLQLAGYTSVLATWVGRLALVAGIVATAYLIRRYPAARILPAELHA